MSWAGVLPRSHIVAILQSNNVMGIVLPEHQESMEWWDYYNMQLQDDMEQN